MAQRSRQTAQDLTRFVALLYGAVLLAWPSLWAGSPVWSPDSITYLGTGRLLVPMLLGRTPPITVLRAEFYCLGIYAIEWNRSDWPVIAMDALLCSWLIWLVVRALCPRAPLAVFAGLIVILSLFTTIPWCISILLPDILGAVLYLALYLLIFMRATLRPWETVALALIACWSITAHPAHLLVAGSLLVLLGLLWLLRWKPLEGCGRFLAQVAGLLLIAVLAQIALHARLWGKLSLLGPQPPFLLARLQGDGPATDYLRANCGRLDWVICKSVSRLPLDENIFLWKSDGVYQTSSPEDRLRLSAEELPLLLGTLRAYPRLQISQSASNIWRQLTEFYLENKTYSDGWTMDRLDSVIPGSHDRFAAALPRFDALPRVALRHMQETAFALSLLLLPLLLVWAIAQHEQSLLGLATVILAVLLSNAVFTAVISGVARRYQARVAWLLPMLVVLMLYSLFERPLPPDPQLE